MYEHEVKMHAKTVKIRAKIKQTKTNKENLFQLDKAFPKEVAILSRRAWRRMNSLPRK
jgi:hypothetical protein